MRSFRVVGACGLAVMMLLAVGTMRAEAQGCPPTTESYPNINANANFDGDQGVFNWGTGQWRSWPNAATPLWPACAATILWMPETPGTDTSTDQALTRAFTLTPDCFLLNIVVAIHPGTDGQNNCGTLTLSSANNAGNDIVQVVCSDDDCVTIDTSGWANPSGEVSVTFTGGSALGIVSLDYCCPEPPPECGCESQIVDLTLQYLGGATADVVVLGKKGRRAPELFNGSLDPGDVFSFVGANNKNMMGSDIQIFVDGELNAEIHTSCSQPIGPAS